MLQITRNHEKGTEWIENPCLAIDLPDALEEYLKLANQPHKVTKQGIFATIEACRIADFIAAKSISSGWYDLKVNGQMTLERLCEILEPITVTKDQYNFLLKNKKVQSFLETPDESEYWTIEFDVVTANAQDLKETVIEVKSIVEA